jgi:hypothetical protein
MGRTPNIFHSNYDSKNNFLFEINYQTPLICEHTRFYSHNQILLIINWEKYLKLMKYRCINIVSKNNEIYC